LKLLLACSHSDRVAALVDGSVTVEGAETKVLCLSPIEVFSRALRNEEFDVCEMSFSSYLTERALGRTRFSAIPVFPSRMFRHSFVFINAKSGIRYAGDLAGKTVGLLEYQMTAAVVARGFLSDDYGISADSVDWVQGGQDKVIPQSMLTNLITPAGVRLRASPDGRTLSEMLVSGELDAVIAPWNPSCFTEGNPSVRRLFPDPLPVELDYYRRTGIFPIMHVIVGKTSLFEAHPWLPLSLCRAFAEAKRAAAARLDPYASYLFTMVPCGHLFVESMRAVMGADLWPYGVEANKAALDALCRWSYEQGLSPRRLEPAELFWPSTLSVSV
jgi:4,5-dihydroxyphthalate decarboxylase